MNRWIVLLLMPGWVGAACAALEPDPSFGVEGLVAHTVQGPTDEGILAMRVDDQDRVVSAYGGIGGRGVSRHLADGTLDAAFGEGGRVVLDFAVRDLSIQPDGRIVAVGGDSGPLLEQDWRLVRLLSNGSVDTSFGTQGEVQLDWYGSGDEAVSVALAGDGDIVVGGRALKPGVGTAFATAIFDAQGDLQAWRADKLFEGTADICNKVLLQSDGKILCAGFSRNFGGAVMAAVRYESDLGVDADFGTGGLAAVTYPEGPAEAETAALLPGGAILLGGFVEDAGDYALALARLTPAGVLDTGFAGDGRSMLHLPGSDTEYVRGLHLDGSRILAAVLDEDAEDFVVAAFTDDGDADTAFGSSGTVSIDFNGLNDLSFAIAGHQGGILVGGRASAIERSAQSDLALARLTGTGTLDTAFSGDGRAQDGFSGPVTSWATDAVLLSDGGVVTVGYAGQIPSARDFLLTAFNADGSVDTAFGQQGSATADFDNGKDEARAVVRLADGRLLVAGVVRPAFGTDDFAVARFLGDGTLDTSFGDQGWAVVDLDGNTDTARDLIVQTDGKILVAGEGRFPSQGSTRDFAVVRFNADGSLDSGFGSDGIARVSVDTFDEGAAVDLQSNGRILVGGTSDGDYVVARFATDGSLDTAFGTGGVVVHDFLGEFDFMRDLLVIDDWQGQGERIVATGMARDGGSSASDEDFAVVMFDTDGVVESGFGNSGQVVRDLSGGQDQVASVFATGSNLVLAGRAATPPDFGVLALTLDGQEDSSFFGGGASFNADFAGSNDEVMAALEHDGALVLAGLSFFPEELGGIQKIALARLAVSQRIFSDRFEQP